MKRYHNFTLTLGLGEEANEYEFLRIGTASEKDTVEKELQELRERLSQVEQWRERREEIEQELSKVWVKAEESNDGQELAPPPYREGDEVGRGTDGEEKDSA